MSVLAAVDAELEDIAKRDALLATGARAEAAREMARQLDNKAVSATAKSMCAKVLAETLDRLHELAPAKKEASRVDEVKQRRERRRARSAGA